MPIYRVRARDSGRRVNWDRLLAGELVDQPVISFSTTVILTDVISGIVELCHSLDPDTRRFCVSTNFQEAGGFVLFLIGKGFEVSCIRALARSGGVGIVESGGNFDVLVTIAAESSAAGVRIASFIKSMHEFSVISE